MDDFKYHPKNAQTIQKWMTLSTIQKISNHPKMDDFKYHPKYDDLNHPKLGDLNLHPKMMTQIIQTWMNKSHRVTII